MSNNRENKFEQTCHTINQYIGIFCMFSYFGLIILKWNIYNKSECWKEYKYIWILIFHGVTNFTWSM